MPWHPRCPFQIVKWLPVALFFGLALAVSPAFSSGSTESTSPRKTVVVLHSLPQDLPGLPELNAAISSTLQLGSTTPIDIYNEYTGLEKFSGETYESSLLMLYKEKYARRKVDLLVAVGPTALKFLVARKFLEGVPVVTCYVAKSIVEEARTKRPELTGVLTTQNAPKTIELMLSMFPKTRRINVVLGASEYEREQAERGRRMFASFTNRLEFVYLNDLSLEQVEAKLKNLPSDELVLFGSLIMDAAGRDFLTNAPLARLSAASRRPIFGVIGEDLGEGILGGVLLSMELSGKASGELGQRVLQGEAASAIPFALDSGAAPMFDWRQLKHWGIREHSLPPGSLVKFRKASTWDTYWKEISAGLGIIAVESLLVAGLIIQLRRRKRTERALADAEIRYRTVADFTHDWEFWQRPNGSFEYVSPACERVSGHAPEAFKETPELLERVVLEEDRAAWQTHQRRALVEADLSSLEYRIRTRDGGIRWVEQSNNPVKVGDAPFQGSRGSIRDITARKNSELELQRAYEEIGGLKDRLEAENTYYREKIQSVEGSSELLGNSDPMKYLMFRIRQVAPSETTVLIQGETGTGKELVAEAVHKLGPRKDRPLVKINCAALPPGLAESELFGHEKGAFTGAQSQRKGRFEVADGATLFLDEVGELSPEVQAKLLRVLQDGEFQRVGGDRTLKVDVRVIAATNRDLAKEVANGRFREDLWYRLNVFPITLPPLRNRKEDIPTLAQTFVGRFCQKLGRPELDLPKSVVASLQAYAWPGNIRELQNIIERAVLVSEGTHLRLADQLESEEGLALGAEALKTLLDMEREHIIRVLDATQWKLEGSKGAAQILGMKPSTLRSRMLKLEIERHSS